MTDEKLIFDDFLPLEGKFQVHLILLILFLHLQFILSSPATQTHKNLNWCIYKTDTSVISYWNSFNSTLVTYVFCYLQLQMFDQSVALTHLTLKWEITNLYPH